MCTAASPEAAHSEEGHEPEPQVGPGHYQDVVGVVHRVQVPVPGVENRLQSLWKNWFENRFCVHVCCTSMAVAKQRLKRNTREEIPPTTSIRRHPNVLFRL